MARPRKQLTPEEKLAEAQRLMDEAKRELAEQGGEQPTLDTASVEDAAPPSDEVTGERDPLEMYDMADDLEKVRRLLSMAGYLRGQTDANSEMWAKAGPGGMRGHTAYLLSDVNRRIRLEIRDPTGMMQTNVSPAYPVDVAIALGLGRDAAA